MPNFYKVLTDPKMTYYRLKHGFTSFDDQIDQVLSKKIRGSSDYCWF